MKDSKLFKTEKLLFIVLNIICFHILLSGELDSSAYNGYVYLNPWPDR
ncbi:MAG: hypothetical protein JWR61_3906 [Ferruginibacter sp.]|nr:hypothetical protein [Ferruginibacter sp.]